MFLNIFDINNLTQQIWQSISTRLTLKNFDKKTLKNRYFKNGQNQIKIEYVNKDFEGIFNYFRNYSVINDEVKITSSSVSQGIMTNLLENNPNKFFSTKNEKNSWVCIEFINNKIIPSSYQLRSNNWSNEYASHLRSWVFEGKNDDSENWEILDEKIGCHILKGPLYAHNFDVQNKGNKAFKYLRIRQTSQSWGSSNYHLCLNCVEIYGQLI